MTDNKIKGKYGEPWKDDQIYANHYGEYMISDFTRERAERAMACVNACVGVEDVEAVKELLETIREFQEGEGEDQVLQLALQIAAVRIEFTDGAK